VRGQELTLDDFEKLSSEIPSLISLMLTGGEPFLRQDIDEIVKLFNRHSHPKVISIITNGTLTDRIKTFLDRLVRAGIDSNLILSFSIDGDMTTHDRMRGVGCYKAVCETARMLDQHPVRSRILTGLNITFCRENQHIPYKVYERILRDIGFDFCSVNLVRSDHQGKYKEVDIDKYLDFSRELNKHNKIKLKGVSWIIRYLHAVKEEYQRYLIGKTYKDKKYQGILCEAGRNIGVISPGGDVYPCELLNNKLGSLRTESFRDIWNKKENISFTKKEIRKGKCFCHHECFLSASINLNFINQVRSLIWYKFLRGIR
jgi:radical SAM protein with 4Fe4S-binding SPASM domain